MTLIHAPHARPRSVWISVSATHSQKPLSHSAGPCVLKSRISQVCHRFVRRDTRVQHVRSVSWFIHLCSRLVITATCLCTCPQRKPRPRPQEGPARSSVYLPPLFSLSVQSITIE